MSAVRVTVRLRPDPGGTSLTVNESTVSLRLTSNTGSHNSLPSFDFTADGVFREDTSQEEVFVGTTIPLLDSALDGYNACIFGYGQTGAGKTHTLFGAGQGSSDRGICPRAISYLFRRAANFKEESITLRLSVLEIYNESLIDLLRGSTGKTSLTIFELPSGISIPNLFIVPLASEGEAMDLLYEASSNRRIAEHQLNRQSSRSHIVYTVYVTRVGRSEQGVESKIHIVDLAGSEKTTATKSEKEVLRQANYINKSLSFLEQVVVALSQPGRSHIPYRQSKLTQALRDCLGGNCLTHLIACVWPSEQHAWETLSTLKFASRMKAVQNSPLQNNVGAREDSKATAALRRRLDLLQRELLARDAIAGSEPWLPELTAQQEYRTHLMLRSVLLDDETPRSFQSLSQVRLLLRSMKSVLLHACDDNQEVYRRRVTEALAPLLAQTPPLLTPPLSSITLPLLNTATETVTLEMHPTVDATLRGAEGMSPPHAEDAAVAAVVSFDEFKTHPAGQQLSATYEETKHSIAANKSMQKDFVNLVNLTKQRIDELAMVLSLHTDFGGLQALREEVDEEPTDTVQEIKASLASLKAEYKRLVAELKSKKQELEVLQHSKQQQLNKVMQAYEAFCLEHAS